MAAIGEIRKRSTLLVFVIALSIVGFLLMDATNSNSRVLGRANDVVGEVNGQTISYMDFEQRVSKNMEAAQLNVGPGANLSDEQRESIRTNTWNEIVQEATLYSIYEDLGIQVSAEEEFELVQGKNVDPMISGIPVFQNPNTGRFDPNQVRGFLQNLDQDAPGQAPGTTRKIWANLIENLRDSRYNAKYQNMLASGIHIPEWQATMVAQEANHKIAFNYVYVPYAEISNDEITITDADYKNYISKNAKNFEQDESRTLKYVYFELKPSDKDSARVKLWIDEKLAELKTREDDSLFIKYHSDIPFNPNYVKKDEIDTKVADQLFSMPIGEYIPTFHENGYYTAVKLIDRKKIPDSVRVSQIVISFNNVASEADAAKRREFVDSLYGLIDSLNRPIAPLAAKFSDDAVSKAAGGDIGWVKPVDLPSYVAEALFNRGSQGKNFKFIIAEANEFRLMQITNYKPTTEAVKLGVLAREVLASKETEDVIYAQASAFAADNRTKEQFEATVNEQGMRAFDAGGIGKNDSRISGLTENARTLVRFSYEANEGDVSGVQKVGNKFVVATIMQAFKEGVPTVEQIKPRIQLQVANEKKYELMKSKISGSSLTEIAADLGKTVQNTGTSPNLSMTNAGIGGVGNEPTVVATAMTMNEGDLSTPIKGANGVFVIQLTSKQTPDVAGQVDQFVRSSSIGYESRIRFGLNDAVINMSELEDNRSSFY